MFMSELIPTGKAAPAVGVSTATLTRWVKSGDVTPAQTTVGGHYRWDLASLKAQVRRLHTEGHDITAEDIARVVHAAQRELQIVQGDPVPAPPWDEAPEYQVRQTIAGVQEIIRNPEITAEQSQELWCERMRADGWTYGPVKDMARKTHPALVTLAELPPERQLRPCLMIAIVRALIAS